MPILTPDDVRHIAHLARLRLTDAEVHAYTEQLDAILAHFTTLQTVPTDGVEPTAHSVAARNVTRADEVRPSLTPEQVVAAAPRAEDNMFVVPQVVETD